MTIERPMFPPRAESVDSFSSRPAIQQPETENLTSESAKPAAGLSRRMALAGLAFLPGAALPVAAEQSADPIFAAIDAFRRADAAFIPDSTGDIPEDVAALAHEAYQVVLRTRPTTIAGLAAFAGWARERSQLDYCNLQDEDFCAFAATIDDAINALRGRLA